MGEISPEVIFDTFRKRLDSGELEAVAIVFVGKDGEIVTGWSNVNNLEVLGMFTAGVNSVMEYMND